MCIRFHWQKPIVTSCASQCQALLCNMPGATCRCKHCRRELSSGSWVKADQSREARNNRGFKYINVSILWQSKVPNITVYTIGVYEWWLTVKFRSPELFLTKRPPSAKSTPPPSANPGYAYVYFRVLTSTEDFIFHKQFAGQAKLHNLCDILLCKGIVGFFANVTMIKSNSVPHFWRTSTLIHSTPN
jgi:hypothetical protein